jgi:hypothetical protein
MAKNYGGERLGKGRATGLKSLEQTFLFDKKQFIDQ